MKRRRDSPPPLTTIVTIRKDADAAAQLVELLEKAQVIAARIYPGSRVEVITPDAHQPSKDSH